jgi:methylmalonyl-CoA/ethylmalonyl-CoA epimerase
VADSKAESAFTKVIQVGIVVKDLDQTIARLEMLGIGPFQRRSLPAGRREWFRDQPMDASPRIAMANIGEMPIELIEPAPGVPSPHREFLETKGEGIQHIACAVDDVEKHSQRLKEQGCEVLLRAHFPGGGGVAYMDLGAGGLIVELIQRPQPAK